MRTIDIKSSSGIAAAAVTMSLLVAGVASAATMVTVTPTNTQGWASTDVRPGGAVNFITDATAPAGTGALQLTTNDSNVAKADYMHAANTPLSQVTELSYYTKQNSGPAVADPSYQLPVNLNGTSGFTTLVYEPYYNGTVTPGVWQQWDVDQGLFWSSRTVTCSNGTITGMAGGPATYTLAQIKSICPNAIVAGFGVNVGSYNPNYNVETDLVSFNGTAYNFELPPTNKNQCKDGGWRNMVDNNGRPFKNQGDCVDFVQKQQDKARDQRERDRDNQQQHGNNEQNNSNAF